VPRFKALKTKTGREETEGDVMTGIALIIIRAKRIKKEFTALKFPRQCPLVLLVKLS
jgi:hypothetical protein